MNSLDALSPLDGRYSEKLAPLRPYLSESALIRYRARVELRWLSYLSKSQVELKLLTPCPPEDLEIINKLELRLSKNSIAVDRVKEIEQETNHDVKAVEYFLAEKLEELGWSGKWQPMIHFACTSEDINNTAYSLMLRDVTNDVFIPELNKTLSCLAVKTSSTNKLAMIARTHGQKATPTTLGKELSVFGARLLNLRNDLLKQKYDAKFNGAVGNYNVHDFCFPDIDWPLFSKNFIEGSLNLNYNAWTTQIEPHDSVSKLCSLLSHVSAVGIDLCRDMWSYISLGYFKQKKKAGEVGSSTMPHKVNPIDFENAEGNFGIAIALAQHFAAKLPVSRLQRDLSDSTSFRSLSLVFGHSFLALQSLQVGLDKLEVCEKEIEKDLDLSYEVLGEAVQSALRLSGSRDAYEVIKDKTRGLSLNKETYSVLVDSIDLSENWKKRLHNLEPKNYVGQASKIAMNFVSEVDRG